MLAPSAGLTSRKFPVPVASESRFQASSGLQTITHPQGEEKDCRGTPTSLLSHTIGGRGSAIFSNSSALGALDPDCDVRKYTWTCLLGKAGPVFPNYHPLQVRRPLVMNCLFPPPLPTLAKDQGGKRMAKRVVQCRSFNVPSGSSKAEPLGETQNIKDSLKALMTTGFQWPGC